MVFKFSQLIELATTKVSELTWPFHHVRALSAKVQTMNLTLLLSGQEQISKTAFVFSIHYLNSITPLVPLKVLGLAFEKSL